MMTIAAKLYTAKKGGVGGGARKETQQLPAFET